MKKNLTKLALSGAALAAVAATLGTSTYAWYTTNPTVSANNIVAGTSDTGSSSIFISKDSGTPKTWSSSVTLTSADFVTLNPSLVPLSYASAGQFKSVVTATGDLEADPTAPGASAAQVRLYFKSSKTTTAQNIYIQSVSVVNTTADADGNTAGRQLPTADNLLYGQKHGTTPADYTANEVGVTSSQATYSVDFRESLAMAINNVDYRTVAVADATEFGTKKASLYVKDGNNYVSQATGTYSADATYYENKGYDAAFSIADRKVDNTTYTAPTGVISNGKAQEYYDAVMDHDLTSAAKTAAGAMITTYAGAAIGVCPTNGTDYITVDFYIYLDGASQFCYDACQGQQFAIDLKFTSDATAAIGYVAGD